MKPGLLFPDEDTAEEAVLKWGERALCPLMKARQREREGVDAVWIVLMGEIEKLTESLDQTVLLNIQNVM